MNKILVTTLTTTALAVSVLAQGTVSLPLASSSRYIQYCPDGTTFVKFPSGSPATLAPWGSLNVAVYYASAGTASPFVPDAPYGGPIPAPWKQSVNVMHNLYGAGVNLATTFTLTSATGGSTVQALVVGWTGNFATWNEAMAAGVGIVGFTGSIRSGGALSWLQGTGNPMGSPPTLPVALVTGPLGYNGLVLGVPEPSMFALAGLGAAALMIFRRRR